MLTKEKTRKSTFGKNNEIDIKDIVKAANNYLKKIMAVKDVLLEEIELSEDGKYWLITLSHRSLSKEKRKRTVSDYLTIPLDRSYRVIKINKSNGTIESMKIREI